MSRFVDRMKTPMQGSVARLPEPTLSLVAQYMGQDPAEEAGRDLPSDVEREEPPKGQPLDVWDSARVEPHQRDPRELAADYGKVGEHVASMLESARAAAVKIQAEAREEARRITEHTRDEAAEVLAGARSRASRLEAEAAQLHAEAAEAVSRAQHIVREQSRSAEGRRVALDDNVTLAEERLGQLVGALRELANRLEDVLEQRQPNGATEVPRVGDPVDDAADPEFSSLGKPAKQRRELVEAP